MIKKLLTFLLVTSLSSVVLAKLPAPNDEAKAKAAEVAAKTAWSGKGDIYLLCKSQDKVAASYYKTAMAAGKDTKPAVATPPCVDAGVFAYVPVEAAKPVEATKPLEAAGAHSPPATAAGPPNTKIPDAVINPGNKAATPPDKKVVEAARPVEATKPLEAAGAHSPPATAASPPNTKIPDAVINPGNKAATPPAK